MISQSRTNICVRENWAIKGQRLKSKPTVEVLNQLIRQRGAPKILFADNGAEFAYQPIDFPRPGKLTYNTFIETFDSHCGANN